MSITKIIKLTQRKILKKGKGANAGRSMEINKSVPFIYNNIYNKEERGKGIKNGKYRQEWGNK